MANSPTARADFEPDWATHPGEHLDEYLEVNNWSQAEFARSIGVKKATLLNWEQGRRKPDGPARVLLALIAKEPGIVRRVLG